MAGQPADGSEDAVRCHSPDPSLPELSIARVKTAPERVERSPLALTVQAAVFCSAPVASSQVCRTSVGVR
jgi:hypothetical protein